MSYWIAEVLREERGRGDLPVADVARILDVNERTIKRLELGHSMGRDIDRVVAAYAYLLGLEDGRELWERAVARWYEFGAPPQFKPTEGPAAAFAEAIRTAALRRRADAAAPSARRNATRPKRATG